MAINIPTTSQISDDNLANYESQISQSSPLNDKSFLRVTADNEASLFYPAV